MREVSFRRETSLNPFHIPGNEEIFRHRGEDKPKKAEARMMAMAAPVAEKTTFASRMQATTTTEAREMIRKLKAPSMSHMIGAIGSHQGEKHWLTSLMI
jgi:hypothetical protein